MTLFKEIYGYSNNIPAGVGYSNNIPTGLE